jgi:hypothetical protein
MSFSYQPINNKKAYNKQNKRYTKVFLSAYIILDESTPTE